MKVLIRVSKGINKDYVNNLKKVINSIKTENKIKKEIEFFTEYYNFKTEEGNQIINNPNDFLDKKYDELSESQKSINSIIYIPDMTLNLKGNFLWYSLGDPQHSVMVFSSFLYKYLIEGKLNFGAYILLIYSQYLARYTVYLKKSHRISKKCLNDLCANQIEILNAFENKKDVLCNECLNNIKNEKYHNIIKNTIEYIETKYYKKKIEKKVEIKEKKPERRVERKTKELKIKSEVEIEVEKGDHYELEIYMAKKCANMAELYKKLGEILSDPDNEIYGYSLYEVGGGYRDNINLPKDDCDKLEKLREKALKNNVNDLIRPIRRKGDKKCVVYDETSIVLRIIVEGEPEIEPLDEPASKVIREIIEIFNEITNYENSIYFTIKKLKKVARIKRRTDSKI